MYSRRYKKAEGVKEEKMSSEKREELRDLCGY